MTLVAEPTTQGGLSEPRNHSRSRRLRRDAGSVPVLVGLALIWTAFQIANDRFLSATNLTNLFLQISALGTLAVGVVFVLLLGEVDLSIGAVSGVSASVMAVANVHHGVNAWAAIALGLLCGAAIGALHGLWFAKLGVPAFVVTLAGFIGWQGAQLWILGDTGTVNITDDGITRLTNTFYGTAVTWTLVALVMAVAVTSTVASRRRRSRAGLVNPGPTRAIVRLAAFAAATVATAVVFTRDRGLPLAVVIFVGIVAICELLISRTTFGRHVLAVGGNAEAARRAGIPVDGIRIAVFVLASTMAAAGGILAASRLLAVNQSSGGGDLLLNAIAAAVIGGTSLFGGRGSARSALLGALVIGSVSNGMDLLAVDASVKFMVTAAVLLAAATIDGLSRRSTSR